MPAFVPSAIQTLPSLWRYRRLLPPLPEEATVSMMEGWTPLVRVPLSAGEVSCKMDFLLPTGSYKDRGATLLVSYLKAAGAPHVHDDSSGNAGAALAGYCARAGIPCDLYIPAHASGGKLAQIQAYGARLVPVPGPREEAKKASMADAASFYASHNWHPLFFEGVKTYAWEVWEQLGRAAPDHVVVPCGYGSLVIGAYRGFKALRDAGEIDRLPRIFAVQASACSPVYQAFAQGAGDVVPVTPGTTLAEGIASGSPLRGREILEAVRATDGAVVTVTEDEIVRALRLLARRGMFVEPTAAAAPAAADRLLREGRLRAADETVVVLTGNGLKAWEKIRPLLEGGVS
ncbi:MAG: threonine synthase [Armatimonadetes bacterium]|nr:threonine synthase [Armatimonadota bacterium]